MITKTQAIEFFGSQTKISLALDISPQAVCKWPENLSREVSDRVELAMIKEKRIKEVEFAIIKAKARADAEVNN
jgi:hypothetical protein